MRSASPRLTREPQATLHRLPNGLNVWLAARMQSRDGAVRVHALGHTAAAANSGAPPTVSPAADVRVSAPAGTLRDTDRHLIEQTVAACEGNVSKAARKLGVSRGLVYRHLKQTQGAPSGD